MAIRQPVRREPRRGAAAAHAVRSIGTIELFDVVALTSPMEGFPVGTEAAVVEIFQVPELAYCLEVVLETGKTAGLFDALPNDVMLVAKNHPPRIANKRKRVAK